MPCRCCPVSSSQPTQSPPTDQPNRAGDTVYKVFNNRIAMNWEEIRTSPANNKNESPFCKTTSRL